MKQGMTFDDVVAQVERDAEHRNDFFAPMNELRLSTQEAESQLVTPQGEFNLLNTAHLHIAEMTGIDRRYYQRLRSEAPALLAENVNHWLSLSGPKPRLIRALDTDVRALASVRYAALDNDSLLAALTPVISDIGGSVESCALSDEGLTLKLVTPKLQGDVKKGDTVQAGLLIRNSEVRQGALSVQPLIFRLVCTNGLILGSASGKAASRRHVGRDWRGDRDYFGVVPENIERAAWEQGIWSQLQDNIREVINAEAFHGILERLNATTKFQTTLEPEEVIERLGLLGPEYKLGPEVQAQVVGHIHADGYTGSLYDILNGVTRAAQGVASYEFSTSLEVLGGRLSALTPREWERLSSLN